MKILVPVDASVAALAPIEYLDALARSGVAARSAGHERPAALPPPRRALHQPRRARQRARRAQPRGHGEGDRGPVAARYPVPRGGRGRHPGRAHRGGGRARAGGRGHDGRRPPSGLAALGQPVDRAGRDGAHRHPASPCSPAATPVHSSATRCLPASPASPRCFSPSNRFAPLTRGEASALFASGGFAFSQNQPPARLRLTAPLSGAKAASVMIAGHDVVDHRARCERRLRRRYRDALLRGRRALPARAKRRRRALDPGAGESALRHAGTRTSA